MFVFLAIVIAGVILFCSTDSEKIQTVAKEMNYVDFLPDGSTVTGRACEYKLVSVKGKIVKIPTILLPLKDGNEVIVKESDGTSRSFFW